MAVILTGVQPLELEQVVNQHYDCLMDHCFFFFFLGIEKWILPCVMEVAWESLRINNT